MKTHAFGTKFNWNGEFVAGLTGINGIEITVESSDVTTHDSADLFAEFIPAGYADGGEVEIEGYFSATDVAGQHAMLSDVSARAIRTGIITFPVSTGATWTFSGFITALKIGDAPVDGVIPFSATVKVTGKPVFAVATVVGMSAISFSDQVLMMPAFAIGKFEYVVTVPNATATATATPVDATSGEVITITANGVSQTVLTTSESSDIALSATEMTDVVVVVSAPNKASKTYTFHIAVLAA